VNRLVVEDLGGGRADPCRRLDIDPVRDADRHVLRDPEATAAGRDLGTTRLAVAVAGKLPHVEEVCMGVSRQVAGGRTGDIGIGDSDDSVQCLGSINRDVRVDPFSGRLVVDTVHDDEIVI